MKLDIEKLKLNANVITTQEALKDVTPIDWSRDVPDGKKEVIVNGIDKFKPFIDENRGRIYLNSTTVTKRDPMGRDLILKDDEWREEKEWDDIAADGP